MSSIDLGVPLQARSGSSQLDEVIEDPVPMRRPDGCAWHVFFDGPEHVTTIGATRTGKSRRLVVPTIVQCTSRAMVVVDIKGDLTRWTACWRARFGEVHVIDPFGVLEAEGIRSAGYNPMGWLDPTSDDFIDDATSLAEAILPLESEREPHFDEGAQDAGGGLIAYFRLVNSSATLGDVRAALSRTPREWKDLLFGDERGITKEGWPCVYLAAKMFSLPALWNKLGQFAELSPEDRELNGFIRSAKTKTRFLDSPPMARDLAKPGIDFRCLRDGPSVAYIVVPPQRLRTHAKWLRLIISGAIEALRKAPPKPGQPEVLFVLDEFAHLGRMEAVEEGVQLNASFGQKYWVIAQTVGQLQKVYDRNWETFTAAGVLTAFGPRDPTTAAYLSKLSGERTIEVRGDSVDAEGRQSSSINRQRRENVMPFQFEHMGKGRMFVRLPSDRHGVARFITQVEDFTDREDVPEEVRRLGRR